MLDMNNLDMTCLFRTKEKRLGTCARQERVSRRHCRAYDGVVSRTLADTATYLIQVFKTGLRVQSIRKLAFAGSRCGTRSGSRALNNTWLILDWRIRLSNVGMSNVPYQMYLSNDQLTH